MSSGVLLLHGQPGSARDWDDVLPLLDGLDLIVRDRPGYDGTGAIGIRDNALAAARTLVEAGLDQAVVVAHSWAGSVALALALERPDLVAGVVLVAPAAVSSSVVGLDRLLLRHPLTPLFTRVVAPAFARLPRLVAMAGGSRITRAQAAAIRDNLAGRNTRADWDAWVIEQRAMLDEVPLLERRLSEVQPEVIVLAGRRDLAVPLIAVRDLAVRLPHVELIELDTGHLLQFEAPGAVADAIRRLLPSGA
jgi:pimeloyl-ACP methyl ester carboxylesterase